MEKLSTNKNHLHKDNEQIHKQNIYNSKCFGVNFVNKSIQKWLVRSEDSLTDYYLTKCLYHNSFDNHAGFPLPSL
jgi:hypothetical protein